MPYREAAPGRVPPPLVLRPRMNLFLIGLVVVLFFGPLYLQATLWSSVVVVRCVREPKGREIECGVTRDAWLSHEARLVNVSNAVGFEAKGALSGTRGDAWIDLEGRTETVTVTPKLNVSKDGLMNSTRELNEWLMRGDDQQLQIRTGYGSLWGAFYVPILSLIACIGAAILVTGRVRMRMIPGGRAVVECSLWLGPRAPFEVAIDDVRCFSLDGPKLVLVMKDGPIMIARSVMPKRAELVIDQGNAWLEEARQWRERT